MERPGIKKLYGNQRADRVPAWVPPAWQIDQWKRRQPKTDDRPMVHIDDAPPPGFVPSKKDDGEKRGVLEIQLV